MCVDFIQGFLIFSLVCLAALIYYQNFYQSTNSDGNTKTKENYFPIIADQCLDCPNKSKYPCKCGGCRCRNCMAAKRCGCMRNTIFAPGQPVHPIGPVINFHQRFKPNLPELTWRGLYMERYNKTLPVRDASFDGTPVRNFLDQLENVDNIYRKC